MSCYSHWKMEVAVAEVQRLLVEKRQWVGWNIYLQDESTRVCRVLCKYSYQNRQQNRLFVTRRASHQDLRITKCAPPGVPAHQVPFTHPLPGPPVSQRSSTRSSCRCPAQDSVSRIPPWSTPPGVSHGTPGGPTSVWISLPGMCVVYRSHFLPLLDLPSTSCPLSFLVSFSVCFLVVFTSGPPAMLCPHCVAYIYLRSLLPRVFPHLENKCYYWFLSFLRILRAGPIFSWWLGRASPTVWCSSQALAPPDLLVRSSTNSAPTPLSLCHFRHPSFHLVRSHQDLRANSDPAPVLTRTSELPSVCSTRTSWPSSGTVLTLLPGVPKQTTTRKQSGERKQGEMEQEKARWSKGEQKWSQGVENMDTYKCQVWRIRINRRRSSEVIH